MTDPVIGDVLMDSLQRRMPTMHSLYYQAVDTMDLEHVNHFEREGVLPIAFSLFHYTNMQDVTFMLITGIAPIWNEEWQARVQMTIDDHGKHRTVDEMIHQRIGDYEAFKEYQRAVFDRTEDYLATMDPADLTRVLDHPPVPTPGRQHLQRRCARDPRASPCSTASSAGTTSTASATWARSNSPAASWASAA